MSDGCVFCSVVKSGEAIEFRRHAIDVVSFVPLNPVTPGHRLFVPSQHVVDYMDDPGITAAAFHVAAMWARRNYAESNLITSAGTAATQTIRHLHIHYVPRHYGDELKLPWTDQLRGDGQH